MSSRCHHQIVGGEILRRRFGQFRDGAVYTIGLHRDRGSVLDGRAGLWREGLPRDEASFGGRQFWRERISAIYLRSSSGSFGGLGPSFGIEEISEWMVNQMAGPRKDRTPSPLLDYELHWFQTELEVAKLEIQKWHAAFQNESFITAGTSPEPGLVVSYLQTLKFSDESLKEQLEKAKKKEAAFIVTFAKREQEIAELKVKVLYMPVHLAVNFYMLSAVRDLKVQLKPPSMQKHDITSARKSDSTSSTKVRGREVVLWGKPGQDSRFIEAANTTTTASCLNPCKWPDIPNYGIPPSSSPSLSFLLHFDFPWWARRLLLDPAIHEEFTRLKEASHTVEALSVVARSSICNLVEEKEKKVKELQDNVAAVNFTPQSKMGKMLMAKCRTLQEENEEIGTLASEGKIHELAMKLALQKSQNAVLRSQFEGLYKHMEGLENDVDKSNEMVLLLQGRLAEKDSELKLLRNELYQKEHMEEENIDSADGKKVTDEVNSDEARN
ncbi:hypothetical protein HHK36_029590 [Tetracentron sinense]|uniref:FKBP12-interacting protein of 37 kDa n=1 Tax=Tetracentron sinense TaxID=13715 RepID=A0A835D1X1_TETSI|nr:hypothetical protein HHK36_029590 [Tetracentron sinense]